MDNSEVEEYRDAVGFEEYFQISNMGNIYSKRSNRIVKQSTSGAGYKVFTTKVNGISLSERVHRMVAMAFLPNELNKPYVNHKDGCKTNNALSNLEWVTPTENVAHAITTGLRDQRNVKARKFTDEQVRTIRRSTATLNELAEIYETSISVIHRIKHRQTYKDIL